MWDSGASLLSVHSIVSLNNQPPHITDNAKTTCHILLYASLWMQHSGGAGGFERAGQQSTMVLYSVQCTCLARVERMFLK
jgi:hypothetical protein